MAATPSFTFFPEPRPTVMVVSHERSGTHFLMNSIAACFGYVSIPFINLDAPLANLYHTVPRAEVRRTLLDLAGRPMANIVKSHHPADFYADDLPALTERYVIFVIVRDPVSVMLSFWRFCHHFDETINMGPRVPDPVAFARAAPSGRITRYQARPFATMLERWANHVEGWATAAETCPRVRLIRFEDLDGQYVATIERIGTALGMAPQALHRPARDHNVVPPGPADPTGRGIPPDLDALRRLCRETVGPTMRRLGYR